MGTAFGAEGGVVSELSEYGAAWVQCWVCVVRCVGRISAGVLACVGLCTADLPSAQGYRIGRVEATTGHC